MENMDGLKRVAAGIVENVDRAAFLEHLARQEKQRIAAENLEKLFLRVSALEEELDKLKNRKK